MPYHSVPYSTSYDFVDMPPILVPDHKQIEREILAEYGNPDRIVQLINAIIPVDPPERVRWWRRGYGVLVITR